MEQEHRLAITRNIGRLVEQTNIDALIPKLLEKRVFTQEMIEKYLPGAGLNAQQCKTALFLGIQRRGPAAFQNLISSLVETEHFDLAELLQPGLDIHSATTSQESVTSDALPSAQNQLGSTPVNLPPYYSSHVQHRIRELSLAHPNAVVNLSTEPLQVTVKYAHLRSDHLPHKPGIGVYPMGSRPKGYFLMINNMKFVNNIHDERIGAEVDDLNLSILFQQLGYEIKSYTDLSLNEMKTKIVQFARMESHKRVHSCVVAISSHGHSGEEPGSIDIIASDGGRLSSSWVLERFNNDHCPFLLGRPKIFIFQTCRGDKDDFGTRPIQRPMSRVVTDGFPASQIRSFSDMLIAYSTIPGYVSNRDIFCGTWYIQTICKVFMEHACDTEIKDLLTMVDNKVKHFITEKNTFQTCSYENWGFQKFYFNPGLYDDENNGDCVISEYNPNNAIPEIAL